MAKEGYFALKTVTGAGNPSYLDMEDIPTTYAHLCLIGNMASTRATVLEQFEINFGTGGTIDSGSNYQWQRAGFTNSTTIAAYRNATTANMYLLDSIGTSVNSLINPMVECLIFGYDDTSRYTNIWAHGGYSSSSSAYGSSKLWSGTWKNTAAVTSLRVTAGSGNFSTTSRLTLYGFKG